MENRNVNVETEEVSGRLFQWISRKKTLPNLIMVYIYVCKILNYVNLSLS